MGRLRRKNQNIKIKTLKTASGGSLLEKLRKTFGKGKARRTDGNRVIRAVSNAKNTFPPFIKFLQAILKGAVLREKSPP